MLPLFASVLVAAVSTSLLPTSDALWAKVLTITGEVNTGEFGTPPDEDEGCTPGFWKQSQHFDQWPEGYEPDQMIGEAFELAVGPDLTLLQALKLDGGDLNALLRHAVAALLNAAHPGANFPYSVEEVIALFQQALQTGDTEGIKDLFEQANEAGCPFPDDGEDEDDEDDGEGEDDCDDHPDQGNGEGNEQDDEHEVNSLGNGHGEGDDCEDEGDEHDDECSKDEGHEHGEDGERGEIAHHDDEDGEGEDEGENDSGDDEEDEGEHDGQDDEKCDDDEDGDHDEDGEYDEDEGDHEQGDVD